MPRKTVQIENIFAGHAPSAYFSKDGQYQRSIAIDPDMPIDDSETTTGTRPSGVLRPTATEDFSGAAISEAPMWLTTNPKNTNIYALTANQNFVSYSSALGSETDITGTPSTGTGNGFAYYNNYIYIFGNADVDRYGPLTSSPSLATDWWNGTVGLDDITNTTYPNTRGSNEIPNHTAHVNVDNKLYFCDFKDGKGLVHFIRTTEVTHEGDTDDGSTYNALDLPFGYYPTSIESYGSDLVVAAMQTIDNTTNQGGSALFFWDKTADSFFRKVTLPDPHVTAMKNVNGVLYIFSGSLSGGVRLSVYAGGNSIRTIYVDQESLPPLQGAVDANGSRLIWGGHTTYPASNATVWAYGSQDPNFPAGVHNIFATDSAGANQIVTSLKYVLNDGFIRPQPIIGWTDDSNHGIDKISTTYGTCYWHSQMYRVGKSFTIKRIRIPLGAAVAANMTLIPKLYMDDSSKSLTLRTINSTNFANSERVINMYPTGDTNGKNNFYLELAWSGTALLPVLLPVLIEFEIHED